LLRWTLKAELSGNGDNTGLDSLRVWHELLAQARAISADQHIAGRG
jgi:hypothetical protein